MKKGGLLFLDWFNYNLVAIVNRLIASMKWSFLLFFLSYTSFSVQAQFGVQGTTYAVVIGISDYADEDIPDLQFADRDARAFSDYLLSAYSGGIEPDQVTLLVNQDATGGKVHNALNQLLEKSTSRDKVFIYFSGHGDVSSTAASDLGHLLLHDTPSGLYEMSSLRITDLQNIAKKISVDIGAELIIITDACRSGNIANSLGEGVQTTSLSLASQFANETKILSCQPNELALEGVKWGGGRGVFSFHLIDGLMGLADKNNDLQVTLRELQRYLEDTVEEDVDPHLQSPMLIGSKNKVMAYVDEGRLAQLVLDKTGADINNDAVVSSILSKGIRVVDSKVGRLMNAFQDALSAGRLLSGEFDSIPSALSLYEQLSLEDIPIAQKQNFKGQLVSVLIDDAQAAINAYLKSDKEELELRAVYKESRYKRFSNYLEVAAELLGTQHYLFGQLKSKSLYFDAVDMRLSNESRASNEALIMRVTDILQQAIIYDSESAFIMNEMGLLHSNNGDFNAALMHYSKAIEIAPGWVIPYSNSANSYLLQKDYAKAEESVLSSIRKDPKYAKAYSVLSKIYEQTGRSEKIESVLMDYIYEFGNNYFIYLELSGYYNKRGDVTNARKYAHLSNDALSNHNAHGLLGVLYYGDDDSLAIFHWEQALLLHPKSPETLNNLAWMYQQEDKFKIAKEFYKRALENDPLMLNPIFNIGSILYNQDSVQQASKYFETIIREVDQDHLKAHVYLSRIYAIKEDVESTLILLDKLKELKYEEMASLIADKDYDELRLNSKFKDWLRKSDLK